jgi:hypothetical protein
VASPFALSLHVSLVSTGSAAARAQVRAQMSVMARGCQGQLLYMIARRRPWWWDRAMDTAQNKVVVEEFDQLGMRGGDLARLDALCTPDMVNHALAPGRSPGLEGSREFLRSARRDVHGARWVEYFIVAENDMVVQFGLREHDWPGGQFRGFNAPEGTTSGTPPLPTGWRPGVSPNAGRSATTSQCCCNSVRFIRRDRPYSPVLTLGGSWPRVSRPRTGH